MIDRTPKLYVTFHTTDEAMAAERVCRDAGIPGRLVPVPRALTSDCGISFRTEPAYQDRLAALLPESKVHFDRLAVVSV